MFTIFLKQNVDIGQDYHYQYYHHIKFSLPVIMTQFFLTVEILSVKMLA